METRNFPHARKLIIVYLLIAKMEFTVLVLYLYHTHTEILAIFLVGKKQADTHNSLLLLQFPMPVADMTTPFPFFFFFFLVIKNSPPQKFPPTQPNPTLHHHHDSRLHSPHENDQDAVSARRNLPQTPNALPIKFEFPVHGVKKCEKH